MIVQRPELYYQAMDAVSRLPKRDNDFLRHEKHVDDDSTTYCILGQESFVRSTAYGGYTTARSIPTSNKMLDSQETHMYYQRTLDLVLGRDLCFMIGENGLMCAPLDSSS